METCTDGWVGEERWRGRQGAPPRWVGEEREGEKCTYRGQGHLVVQVAQHGNRQRPRDVAKLPHIQRKPNDVHVKEPQEQARENGLCRSVCVCMDAGWVGGSCVCVWLWVETRPLAFPIFTFLSGRRPRRQGKEERQAVRTVVMSCDGLIASTTTCLASMVAGIGWRCDRLLCVGWVG